MLSIASWTKFSQFIKQKQLWIFLGGFVLIGIFLRFNNLSQNFVFEADSGSDLMVARDILRGNPHFLGPFLSIEKFYVPPTYYYLLAGFLYVGKNPVNVTFMFGLMNLLSIVVFYLILKKLFSRITAVWISVFLLVAFEMVVQSRMIWQPWPITLFISLAIYLMCISFEKTNLLIHWLGIFFFGLACSVYFSPVITGPYFLALTYKFYTKKIEQGKIVAIISTIYSYLLLFFPIYLPQFIYESQNNFPTLHALFSDSVGQPASLNQIGEIIFTNIYFFLSSYFFDNLAIELFIPVLLLLTFRYRKEIRTTIKEKKLLSEIFDFKWIILGFMVVLFYKKEIVPHRLIALEPFFALLLGLYLEVARKIKKPIFSLVIFTMIAYLILINLYSTLTFNAPEVAFSPENTTAITGEMASKIVLADVRRKNLSLSEYEPHVFRPYDLWDYGIFSLLYYLSESTNQEVKFNHPGNDLALRSSISPDARYFYLFCQLFKDNDRHQSCFEIFKQRTTAYKIMIEIEQEVALDHGTYLYILKRTNPHP